MAGLMLQGTGSDVGKSVLVAGLCRALANRGLKVLPFKPQNMSNNAAVTADGGEIGRAQALQALAAQAELHTDMNPVLLKPEADHTSQLVVHGKVRGRLGSANFREGRRSLLPDVLESWERLQARCDLVVVEGAGSPAEINLREGDIANMGFARVVEVDLIILPGTKATMADLAFVREQGWDIDVLHHHRRGGLVLGICGGFQMLGRAIADPLGIEGMSGTAASLGLLDVRTELGPRKELRKVAGTALEARFEGYEMHMGVTTGADCAQPFAHLDGLRADGAISADGRVMGTYCHGLLSSPTLRGKLLHRIGAQSSGHDHAILVDHALDQLAKALEKHLDIDALIALAKGQP